MDRFDRQRQIAGWDQQRLEDATALVCGRGWLGTFTVWGLASLGIGRILWVGMPARDTDAMASWFLADPSPFSGCAIHDYPFDVEFGSELEWIQAGEPVDVALACTKSPAEYLRIWRSATDRRWPFRGAVAMRGGCWIGSGCSPSAAWESHAHPVVALVAAALLVDASRELLSPLREGRYAEGSLALSVPVSDDGHGADQVADRDDHARVLLVGVGGIGVYAATVAAALGLPTLLMDDDRVDSSNLNRQGLFDGADAAAGMWKAAAACGALRRMFPGSSLRARIGRAGATIGNVLEHERITHVLSAVDNAESRLFLQDAARDRGVSLVQGGTDVFAADVYTQPVGGRLLDEQMRGAMTRGREQERARPRRRGGGCAGEPSYVVPGMVAAGLMVHRVLQLIGAPRPRDLGSLSPWHWRSGGVPVEGAVNHDVF